MSDPPGRIDPADTFDLAGVFAEAALPEAATRPLPPVHLWDPPVCGEINIRIARDGTWFHEGAPIVRAPLVRLFSTVLRRDADGFYLVTPAEKLRIVVEDAPFLAVAVERVDADLRFRTNLGDETTAGPDRPIRVETDGRTGEPSPYVRVRGGLDARMTRSVFYRLVELASVRDGPDGAAELRVESGGCAFSLGRVEAGP